MRAWLILAASLLTAGCSVDPPDGVFRCSTDAQCPEELRCYGGFCYREDPEMSGRDSGLDAAAVDADLPDGGTGDAYRPDAGPGEPCDWERTFGSSGFEIAFGVDIDTEGNIYVGGSFSDRSAILGAVPSEPSMGGADGFVASYAPDGEPRWVAAIGSVGEVQVRAVVVDEAHMPSRVLAGGSFFGTLEPGGQMSVGGRDAFVAALDLATGDVNWIKTAGGEADEVVESLAVLDGFVVAGGFYGGSSPDMPAFAGMRDGFIAWMDDSTWVTFDTVSSTGIDEVKALAVHDGNLLVAGFHRGDRKLPGSMDRDGFVLRYPAVGVMHDAAVNIGGPEEDAIFGIAASPDGIYVVGEMADGWVVGGVPIETGPEPDGFVARLHPPTLDVTWSHVFGTTAMTDVADTDARGYAVAVDDMADLVWVTGFARGADFEGTTIGAVGGNADAFVASFIPSPGGAISVRPIHGPMLDEGRGLAPCPGGGVHVVGRFQGEVTLPSGLWLPGAGDSDGFMVTVR